MLKLKPILLATTLSVIIAQPAYAAKIIPAAEPAAASASTTKATASASSTVQTPASSAQVAPVINQPRIVVAAAEPAPAPKAPTPPAAPRTAAPAAIDTGFYLGAQLGDSSVGAVMGYQFNKMFGMEISYDYFDPIYTRAVTTTIAEKNRLGASGLAMFPLKFSDMGPMALYVKVGYARTTDKLTTDDPGLPPSIPASNFVTITTKTGVTGGAGVHVDMSSSASVRLGVNVVGAEHTTYLAALYRF